MKLRKAKKEELFRIIELYADDVLGQSRETLSDPLDEGYVKAFDSIDRNPQQELLVLVDDNNLILGTLQITYVQYLNRMGSKRAIFEAVRIDKNHRGKGLGEMMCKLAINRAKENGVKFVQLFSDKQRTDALRFYQKIGFTPSHEGFKMNL
ncbi:GNAT family N-acetyltransferase [Pedobacter nutrimenti]|uniref:L-amino acid N-acyltransferase YncA n=1 Tax=Pedobacter nutrimenti TaxID=1241337 RepID=A0A318UTR3_9SPHI|nr:GNAT family N-acetyltransferase [Pedobacter nutrimenti]PYF77425.1 L-amino acid N-acyltransferase YncA [Pedobacter nutrimenti]